MPRPRLVAALRPHLPAAVPGLLATGLMIVWAVDSGGFDADTWYWGALLLLSATVALRLGYGRSLPTPSRAVRGALICFALYVAWSYLSITWAQDKGTALDGSNRALLYLLVFALMSMLPWTRQAALAVLLTFAAGLGITAVVLVIRLGNGTDVSDLFVTGRLAAPTGYINSTAALFTVETIVAVALAASQRRLPAPLRGLLLAFAAASLALAVIVQSRGWLFTLPLVAVVAIVIATNRLRTAAAVLIPILAVLAEVHRLLHLYQFGSTASLNQAAVHASRGTLLVCFATFVAGTLLAWADQLWGPRGLGRRAHQALGGVAIGTAIAGVCAAALVVSHGHPIRLIVRQWHGFSHQQTTFAKTTHFTDVGSGRYDFWRVAIDAFRSHPIGGLGQDNFVNYYLTHRRTDQEPDWTHSLELRLLAHTGAVGFLLFMAFLVFAITAAARARRRGDPAVAAIAAVALLPLVDWLIHGSLDWFWEMPALAAPALGFLGMAGALAPQPAGEEALARRRIAIPRPLAIGAAAVAGLVAVIVLAFPYLSAREVSIATDIRDTNPTGALNALSTAARLDPLSSQPGLIGGAVALQSNDNAAAVKRFAQAIDRDRGAWFPWLGRGLAESALGQRDAAQHDFEVANAIDHQQPAVTTALKRVQTAHPLTSDEAFRLLIVIS